MSFGGLPFHPAAIPVAFIRGYLCRPHLYHAVFNYDLPQDEEYYVHRIGRTGRAGKLGMAFSFVVGREVYKLKDIRRYCKARIKSQPIPSLNDVTETRVRKLFDRLDGVIQDQNLNRYIDMVEKVLDERDYTSMDVAAALLYEYIGTGGSESGGIPDGLSHKADLLGKVHYGNLYIFIVGYGPLGKPAGIPAHIHYPEGLEGKDYLKGLQEGMV